PLDKETKQLWDKEFSRLSTDMSSPSSPLLDDFESTNNDPQVAYYVYRNLLESLHANVAPNLRKYASEVLLVALTRGNFADPRTGKNVGLHWETRLSLLLQASRDILQRTIDHPDPKQINER